MNTKTASRSRAAASAGDVILVGIDDGYAMTKLVTDAGQVVKIASTAKIGAQASAIGVDNGAIGAYESDGQKFTVGTSIDGEGTRFDEYPFSVMNRVIVNHALHVAGLGGRKVRIASGLPVGAYYKGTEANTEAIARKRENLAKPVRSLAGHALAEITDNVVFSEGVAAWVDYRIGEGGEVKPVHGAVAIVDIGGRTTDTVIMIDGHHIDHSRSGTANIGVLDLHAALETKIRAKFDLASVPHSLITGAIEKGSVRLWGADNDVRELLLEAKRDVEAAVLREVQRRIGRGAELEKIVFVGGGAVVFNDIARSFANGEIVKNPDFANARGMLKYMQHVIG